MFQEWTASFRLDVLPLRILSLADTSPERSKGISFHFLPKRVADILGRKWGLVADATQEALQTPQEFLSFVREQSPDAKENGVWIVVTHFDAYGQAENKLLADVKAVCRRQRISLFIARASELANGWKRYD